MNIVTVLPLTKNRTNESLKYFSSLELKVGAIVSISIRSKNTIGIVIEIRPLTESKSDIRNLDYQLKKLNKVKTIALFPATIMKSAISLSDFYISSIGNILNVCVAKEIFSAESPKDAKHILNSRDQVDIHSATIQKKKIIPEIFAIQGDDEDRMSLWRTIIRQEFAQKKSIIFYAPTSDDATRLYENISKGIEEYSYLINGDDALKSFRMKWNNISNNNHPIIIIATPTYIIFPRNDIGTVVIEKENGFGWIGARSPYIDMRFALERFAIDEGRVLFLSDKCLSINTLFRLELNEIQQGALFKWRLVSNANDSLIDMKEELKKYEDETGKKHFFIISKDLDDLIIKNKIENNNMFIYNLRRGYSSLTICNDCGTIYSCTECGAPLILHKNETNQRNFYLCHKCGERSATEDICKKCLGTNIATTGIGIEKVIEEIRTNHPGTEIISLDPDTEKTNKAKNEAIQSFMNKPGSILVGTETALERLKNKVDYSAIVSIDSLFSIPDYRINERIMYILSRMRSMTRQRFIIQTRQSRERIFEYGRKGNISDYYRDTIEDRKKYSFPPFSTLIKITITGNKDKIAEKMAEISRLIAPREIDVFPVFTREAKGKSSIHGIIKLERGFWPNTDLANILRNVDRDIMIKINPETLS